MKTECSPVELIDDFLGSVHVFSTAMNILLTGDAEAILGRQFRFAHLKLLHLIALSDGHSIGEVAAFLGVSSPAASKAVDQLVRASLVRRFEAPTDRRAVELSLTDAGRQVLATYHRAIHHHLQSIFDGLPAERLRETSQLLDRLSIAMVGHDGGPAGICFRCGMHFRRACLLRQEPRCQCHLLSAREGIPTWSTWRESSVEVNEP